MGIKTSYNEKYNGHNIYLAESKRDRATIKNRMKKKRLKQKHIKKTKEKRWKSRENSKSDTGENIE